MTSDPNSEAGHTPGPIESTPSPVIVGSTHEAVGYFYDGTPCPLGVHHVSPVRVTSTAPFTLIAPSIRQGAIDLCRCSLQPGDRHEGDR